MYVSLVERLNGIQDLPSIPNTLNKVLSELFVEAIRYHHRPQGAGPYTAHASVLFLADQLCKKITDRMAWRGCGQSAFEPQDIVIVTGHHKRGSDLHEGTKE